MPSQQLKQVLIAAVVRRTGCTQQQAIDELISEEWNEDDAVLNLRAWKKEMKNA